MIWALRGTVHSKFESSIVLEVNGVFYEILMTSKHVSEFETGEEAMIYTREIAKENSPIELVGFPRRSERALYDALVKVSGIGPKNALKILDVTDFETFANAINSKDIAFLRSLPSVGTKTAERMIVELAGKIQSVEGETSEVGEAVETMIALGFSRAKAFEAVKKATKDGAKNLEEIVKKALSFVNQV
ncbi:Holliday junction branch migration protein RuvA [Mesoaciditoga lauensis]|uniref:Holliday junction branch migration protein RuvA n=1 Tax=Mesoaciditoga lauensis TaxID=1495039 RepID=UPI00055EC494|nr:Holliday junction branch migration protein RuvA [Mesoaciditoga lauensis]